MNKRTKRRIIIIIVVVLIVAAISLGLGFGLHPVGGSVDRKHIVVSSVYGDYVVSIPIKLVKGLVNPGTFNRFNSDKSIDELCDLYSNDIQNNKGGSIRLSQGALLYNVDNTLAQAQLIVDHNSDYKYVLHNGAAQIDGIAIIVPFYMATNYELEENFDGKLILVNGSTFDDIKNYYGMFDKHIVIDVSNDKELTLSSRYWEGKKLKITYTALVNKIKYTII